MSESKDAKVFRAFLEDIGANAFPGGEKAHITGVCIVKVDATSDPVPCFEVKYGNFGDDSFPTLAYVALSRVEQGDFKIVTGPR